MAWHPDRVLQFRTRGSTETLGSTEPVERGLLQTACRNGLAFQSWVVVWWFKRLGWSGDDPDSEGVALQGWRAGFALSRHLTVHTY